MTGSTYGIHGSECVKRLHLQLVFFCHAMKEKCFLITCIKITFITWRLEPFFIILGILKILICFDLKKWTDLMYEIKISKDTGKYTNEKKIF